LHFFASNSHRTTISAERAGTPTKKKKKKKYGEPFLGMMPSWSLLTRAKHDESVWLNGLYAHQSPKFQRFNCCWRDDYFVFFLK
jgi:hypothetical protein